MKKLFAIAVGLVGAGLWLLHGVPLDPPSPHETEPAVEVPAPPTAPPDAPMPSARPGRAAEAAVPVAEAGPERDAPPPAPGIRVTGRLLDPDGRPAAGCTITALEAGAGKKPSSARSDASGAFQLRLTPGAFRFDAHDGTRVLERPVEIVVPDGAPAPDVQLRLAAGRAVSGTVRDTQGRPIAAALVFLDPVPRKKDNVPDPIGPRRAVSDAAGRYAFAGLRAGVFAQLRAEGVGFFPSEPRRGVVGGGNDPSGDLVLRPCATLSGIVVGPDEKPLAGAIVGAHQVGETTADAQGAFRLDRLPGGGGRGVQVLGRSADRRHIGKDEVFLSEGEAREGYRLVLQRSAAIRGRVLDPQGRGVAGARMTTLKEITPERAAQEEFVTFRGNLGAPPLQLNLPDLSARNARLIEAAMQAELQMVHRRRAADQQAQEGPAETDGEGRFEIFGLWPGKYHLQADAEGFLPPDPAIQVDLAQLGEEAFREIVLHRGAVVTGVVRGADGPLKGAHVFALQGAAYRADVTTDEEGAYRATGLPAGDYELFSRTEAYELLDQKSGLRFEIDQEYRGVDFLLLPGGRVQGRVLDSSGAPVAKASVTVQSTREGQVKRDAPTGDDGAYEVENLYDGEYAVIVVADGWLPYGPAPIPVRRGDRLSHDVQLRRAGFVTGRVVGPNGQPVAGALFVLRQGDLRETTNTDPEGRFELTGLRPGVHEMYCRSDDYTLNSRGEVTLEPEERREGLVIRIDPALVARGRVLGPDGRGRSGRKVIAVSRTNEQVRREGVTGGDGTFTVPNLYEGRYRFFLEGQEDAGGADAVVERGRAPPQLLLNARE